MDVSGVVVVGAATERVDALTEVGGVPMVALAARGLLATGLVARVCLHDLGARPEALERACADLRVSARVEDGALWLEAHTRQRQGTTPGDGSVTARPGPSAVILLHDAARPLAPAALGVAVVEAVRAGHAMSVPVLPLSDTVKHVDADGIVRATPDRAGLRVVQTPVAVRADLLTAADAADPLGCVRRRLEAGGAVHTVPGDPAAFAVRTDWDLELARLLAERTVAG